jgi:hypothetical protein
MTPGKRQAVPGRSIFCTFSLKLREPGGASVGTQNRITIAVTRPKGRLI